MLYPIALGMPSGAEWIIVAAVGLLLFGKRLPEVGRSLGKGIVEFKKGLKGVEDEAEAASEPKPPTPMLDTQAQPTAALPSQPAPQSQVKVDPYTGKPVENTKTTSLQD